MLKKLSLVFVLFLTACGWHFKNSERLPEDLRTLTLESADQYSDMSRIMRAELIAHDVNLVPKTKGVATLRLNNTSSSSQVASVFKQAREAEKILSVTVSAAVDIPNKGTFPLEVAVHRTFFDDSRAALAKSEERESIIRQMYEQAARQLMIKMSGLHKEIAPTAK